METEDKETHDITKKRDKQSRKWQRTINNPAEKELSHHVLKEILSQIKPIPYYCMSNEIASSHHTHIYIHCTSLERV